MIFKNFWSPYVIGVGIGILVWIGFLISNKALGCSTAYARTIGMFEKLINKEKVKKKPYYKKYIPEIEWQWMLVLGIFVGSSVSSLFSGSFSIEMIPLMWESTFGGNILIRFFISLIGGIFVGFGARLAGGCTSGHGISGTSQLSVGSWVSFIFFFVGGMITAFILFGSF